MAITIEERAIEHVTVLDIAGRLNSDQGARHLKDKINSLVSQGQTRLVLNLANVPYIHSTGLGQLAASFASVTKAGGALKLLHVNSRNSDLLSITRLDSFDSEMDAARSFQAHASEAVPL